MIYKFIKALATISVLFVFTNMPVFASITISTLPVSEIDFIGGENVPSNGGSVHKILSTLDGGYVTVGEFYTNTGDFAGMQKGAIPSVDAFITKYNSAGDVVWTKSFGGSGCDVFTSVVYRGGYLTACGATSSVDYDLAGKGVQADDALLVRYDDMTGAVSFIKVQGGTGFDEYYDIATQLDGKYVLSGISDDNKAAVSLYAADGTFITKTLLNTNNSSEYMSVGVLSDGSVVVSGSTNGTTGVMSGLSKGGYDGVIVKYSSSLVYQSIKTFGGSSYDALSSLCTNGTDTSFYVGGTSESSDGDIPSSTQGLEDMILLKVSASDLSLQNINVYGGEGSDFLTDINMSNTGIVISGGTNSVEGDFISYEDSDTNSIVFEVDTLYLGINWQCLFGGSGYDTVNSSASFGSTYFVAGITASTDVYMSENTSNKTGYVATIGNTGLYSFGVAFGYGTAYVTGISNNGGTATDYVIPDTYMGMPVTGILEGAAFFQ